MACAFDEETPNRQGDGQVLYDSSDCKVFGKKQSSSCSHLRFLVSDLGTLWEAGLISVIIPTCKDDGYLERVIESLKVSRSKCTEQVEILVLQNTIGKPLACNLGARLASGETLVFLDEDCPVSENFLPEVSMKAKNPHFVGGGVKKVIMERISLGIICAMIPLGFYLLMRQITAGAFWVRREVYERLGGFTEKRKYLDLDFAVRLKKYAKRNGKKSESLKESHIIWSTRRFDKHGDWHWLFGYKTGAVECN